MYTKDKRFLRRNDHRRLQAANSLCFLFGCRRFLFSFVFISLVFTAVTVMRVQMIMVIKYGENGQFNRVFVRVIVCVSECVCMCVFLGIRTNTRRNFVLVSKQSNKSTEVNTLVLIEKCALFR